MSVILPQEDLGSIICIKWKLVFLLKEKIRGLEDTIATYSTGCPEKHGTGSLQPGKGGRDQEIAN